MFMKKLLIILFLVLSPQVFFGQNIDSLLYAFISDSKQIERITIKRKIPKEVRSYIKKSLPKKSVKFRLKDNCCGGSTLFNKKNHIRMVLRKNDAYVITYEKYYRSAQSVIVYYSEKIKLSVNCKSNGELMCIRNMSDIQFILDANFLEN